MNRDQTSKAKQLEPNGSRQARKAYHKPAVLAQESIEVVAAACTPTDPGPGKDPSSCTLASS